MKEAIVQPNLSVRIVDSPIPKPGPGDVLIKAVVSGSNPKDWKLPVWSDKAHNSGDDVAGTVAAVGEGVYEFAIGDRVAGFHETLAPQGSFAEYAIVHDYVTFKIPDNISFEEAATVPLAAMTSAIGVYQDLKLPYPWANNPWEKTPFLVYGASSACGAFAAQLGRLAGLNPIIGVAGRATEFAKQYVDQVVDYRSPDFAGQVAKALAAEGIESDKVKYVFDAISEQGSHENIAQVVSSDAIISQLLDKAKFAKSGPDFKYPDGVKDIYTSVGTAFKENKDFAYLTFKYIAKGLGDGRFKAHPFEVIPGGLNGLEGGLKKLKSGEASGLKYVFRIEETEGAGQDRP